MSVRRIRRRAGGGARANVLDEDVEFAELVPPDMREQARQASVAAVLQIPAGSWNARAESGLARGGYGLLILDGLLVRRVGLEGRFGAELLAGCDVLRPWESDGDEIPTMSFEMEWRVVHATRFAVLDLAWAARMARYPQVSAELVGRALARSRRLATVMAISQQPRLDVRLWMLLWELADRFGTVHPDGVHLDLPLTHELLGQLAAARRPSVSGALAKLAETERVRREGRTWIIAGEPPANSPARD